MYVQTILDVHKKYNALVMSAFNNDAGFVAALDKVCIMYFAMFQFDSMEFELFASSQNVFLSAGLWEIHQQ